MTKQEIIAELTRIKDEAHESELEIIEGLLCTVLAAIHMNEEAELFFYICDYTSEQVARIEASKSTVKEVWPDIING